MAEGASVCSAWLASALADLPGQRAGPRRRDHGARTHAGHRVVPCGGAGAARPRGRAHGHARGQLRPAATRDRAVASAHERDADGRPIAARTPCRAARGAGGGRGAGAPRSTRCSTGSRSSGASSARRALAAQEGERVRIARELHDEVGQALTAVAAAAGAGGAPDGQPASEVAEAREAARATLEEVREIARGCGPRRSTTSGLASALAALTRRRVARDAACGSSAHSAPACRAGAEEELVVYRVAQEALTNVARHAARRARRGAAARRADGRRAARSRDDGRGLRSGGARRAPGCAACASARVLVGATLAIESAGRGDDGPAGDRRHVTRPVPGAAAARRRPRDGPPRAAAGARCRARPARSWPRPATAPRHSSWRCETTLDLAVLDVSMPRMTGLQATAELARRTPELRVLMLSMHDNEQYLFEALKAGRVRLRAQVGGRPRSRRGVPGGAARRAVPVSRRRSPR